MLCKLQDCERPTSGKSKYCREHKAAARAAWSATVAASYAERDRLDAAFKLAFARAHEAGVLAGEACTPKPMYIVGYPEPISEGVCGFAWVKIRPGNCKAANYAKKHLNYRPDYNGGVSLWVHYYNQSYERKVAFARAYSKVLEAELAELDPKAQVYYGSRLD